jgi:hypothetical protein
MDHNHSGMKLLLRLIIVLIGFLVAIALPAMPAQGACGTPFIELSSSSGVPGTQVAVQGQLFQAGTYVDIYYDGAIVAVGSTDVVGNFAVAITIPEGCKGHHQVHAEVLPDTADAYFTVKPGLTVSPEKGLSGTNATVRGRGFAKNEQGIELRYYANGNYETIGRNITADAKGSWKTSFPIPPSASGDHKLDAQGAESKLPEVEDATFRVTTEISIDKSWGIVGDTIVMTGREFVAYESGIQILFADQPVLTGIKANAQGDWEESFNVPEMRTGTYSVSAEGEQTRKEDISELNFKIEPGIVLLPEAGYVGMNLTVTGRGFAANEDVNIMYDGGQVATAGTNDKGSFETSFPVPESKHGEHQVTAEGAKENKTKQSALFTMESDPPPMPTLISPSNKSMVGLIGRVRPRFEWSEVSDDSGVHYSLQIAANADVGATGEFLDPIVSVEGLAGTSYALEEPKALPYGIYYWIVQVVDGAENKSGWTAARSLRAGLLPLWGFIAIIIAAVMGIIALIRSLLVRR